MDIFFSPSEVKIQDLEELGGNLIESKHNSSLHWSTGVFSLPPPNKIITVILHEINSDILVQVRERKSWSITPSCN